MPVRELLLGETALAHTVLAELRPVRRGHNLAWGDHLYVDDLVTLPAHRGRGHARTLLDWVLEEARRLGCVQLHLDSGTHRHDAHRLYLGWGMAITSFHLAVPAAPA